MDCTGKKTISINSFESSLNDFKIEEDPEIIDKVFFYLDKHNYGQINYEDFLNKLKVKIGVFNLIKNFIISFRFKSILSEKA